MTIEDRGSYYFEVKNDSNDSIIVSFEDLMELQVKIAEVIESVLAFRGKV